jgi:hypothetical protein
LIGHLLELVIRLVVVLLLLLTLVALFLLPLTSALVVPVRFHMLASSLQSRIHDLYEHLVALILHHTSQLLSHKLSPSPSLPEKVTTATLSFVGRAYIRDRDPIESDPGSDPN